MGSYVHQVLFHMTSSEIIKDEESVTGFMVKNNVKYIRLVENSHCDNYNMLMLTDTQIKYYNVDEVLAGIQCHADSSFKTGTYEYQVISLTYS